MCSIFTTTDVADRIFDCLLSSMAAMQAEDICASFLFVGDLNGIISSGRVLRSTTTNSYGVAAFNFTTVSSCNQLIVGPTHGREENFFLTPRCMLL